MSMNTQPHKVKAGSPLAQLIDEASLTPVLLEKDGILYRLAPEEEDIWAGYDPEKVKQALTQTAGLFADLDPEKLIADVYAARREGSRAALRPEHEISS
jgi:hypothetical protein